MLTPITLCILAASFCKLPVLGDWTFDRENEIEIRKCKMFWKVDSISFPMRYHMPNLDFRNASKSGMKNGTTHQISVLCIEVALRTWVFPAV